MKPPLIFRKDFNECEKLFYDSGLRENSETNQ